MSKHNYSQYSNNKKNNNEAKVAAVENVENVEAVETVVAPVAAPSPEVKVVPETVETVSLPKTVKGVVANCAKLNVRVKPNINADVVCVLNGASEIEINVAKSNKDWFYVSNGAGVEGYCMRKFVNARV